ncbi:hypothetical protein JQK87_33925 [Streptomyces sp. G44]|uniref:hypothetical protein n=1 Tax=Streptomyces sp. G44 TaxID=2807632 RepID=UPI0019606D4A|nr:hypothetical protein [Streptomyces sp. G44]MBM7173300.1 hypothetical protein [Streptomyces sp. G44]
MNPPADAGDQGRKPQLPPRGGPRAELPGGNPQPRVPSWSDENAQPQVSREPFDTPRGHEEHQSTGQFAQPAAAPDDRQGPGSTAEFPRPDFDAPAPGAPAPQDQGTGQFVRSDVFGGQGDPQQNRQQAGPGRQQHQPGQPGQQQDQAGAFAQQGGRELPDRSVPRPPAPRRGLGGAQQGVPQQQPQQPQATGQHPQVTGEHALPAAAQPEDLLPAAGPGDGRTPLYDTLETNWFQQQQHQRAQAEQQHRQQEQQQAPQGPDQQRPLPSRPQRQGAPAPADGNGTANGNAGTGAPATWRSSPNDELGRQAERVRQPTAGGITTSGLPRRVPRANLVAGTAQQQQDSSTGPQVSRAPDDVRGRLTNLRRGIQQGRQAGTGQTGSFPRPTHQQER